MDALTHPNERLVFPEKKAIDDAMRLTKILRGRDPQGAAGIALEDKPG
jgi:hypothetical protein